MMGAMTLTLYGGAAAGLDAPRYRREQIPLHLDSSSTWAAGEQPPRNPFLFASTLRQVPACLVDEGAARQIAAACALFESGASCCTWPTATAMKVQQPASGPKPEAMGCCLPNATLATALFRRSRAREGVPTA